MMADTPDLAHALFPSDAPAASAPSGPVASAPTQSADAPAQPAGVDPDEAAKRLFDTERPADADAEISGAMKKLDGLADSVRQSGDSERADLLNAAGDALVLDALEHGMGPGDLQEIVGMVHEAAGAMSEMTAEQLRDGEAKGLRELAASGVTDDDLNLARGLVKSMEAEIPCLSYQLAATGLGNDVLVVWTVLS